MDARFADARMDPRAHWETVYQTRRPHEVSWYRARLDASLALIEAAADVEWRCGDATTAPLPANHYDVWHDRAAFHFLTRAEDRAAYVRQVQRSVKPGGRVVVATFGPAGPQKCSGLDVVRYAPNALLAAFGSAFRLETALTELHETPAGTVQPFTYCRFRLEPAACA